MRRDPSRVPNFMTSCHETKSSIKGQKMQQNGHIQRAWLLLAETLEIEPTHNMYTDLRNSFFAGALTIMKFMEGVGKNYASNTEEADVAFVESLHQECEEFRMEVAYDPEQN